MNTVLTRAELLLAIISAILWFIACFVRVRYAPQVDANGLIAFSISSNGDDILRTAVLQTGWNAAAATVAGLAALCRAAIHFFP
jgi:hypothetical protein